MYVFLYLRVKTNLHAIINYVHEKYEYRTILV